MKLLSNNHVAGLLGLGLKDPSELKPIETRNPPIPSRCQNENNIFSMEVAQDFEDDPREIFVEIMGVESPEASTGFGGSIDIQVYDANGDDVDLTPLARERAMELAAIHIGL